MKGFSKVQLEPGESKTVTLRLDSRSFSYYDISEGGRWYVEPGEFEILVGASCDDIRLSAKLTVTSKEKPRTGIGGAGVPRGYTTLDDAALEQMGLVVPPPQPPLPINANTTFEELSSTGFFAWLFVQSLVIGAKQSAKGGVATGLGEGEAAVSVVVGGLKGSSLRSLQLMTGGMFTDTIVEALVHLFNGRLLSAFLRFFGIGKVSRSMGLDDSTFSRSE